MKHKTFTIQRGPDMDNFFRVFEGLSSASADETRQLKQRRDPLKYEGNMIANMSPYDVSIEII